MHVFAELTCMVEHGQGVIRQGMIVYLPRRTVTSCFCTTHSMLLYSAQIRAIEPGACWSMYLYVCGQTQMLANRECGPTDIRSQVRRHLQIAYDTVETL